MSCIINDKIYKYKKKIPNDFKLIIKEYKTQNNIKIKVVRDDLIIGGTKLRAWRVFKNIKEQEIVYAGPYNGYAQVALAVATLKLNKCCTIFLSRGDYPITTIAKKYNANIIVKENAKLYELQNYAKEYAKKHNAYLMPFGFDDKKIIDELIYRIIKSCKNVIDRFEQYNFWLVGGSGTLLKVLYNVFPNSYFNVVQVGKSLDKYKNIKNVNIIVSEEHFYDDAKFQPPYKTEKTYDAKLWIFVNKYAKEDDIVWNVAGN